MRKLANILVFVSLLAGASECHAQFVKTGRPVQRLDRWLGLGNGHGYHWNNPGPDSSYYNPWSPHNSSLAIRGEVKPGSFGVQLSSRGQWNDGNPVDSMNRGTLSAASTSSRFHPVAGSRIVPAGNRDSVPIGVDRESYPGGDSKPGNDGRSHGDGSSDRHHLFDSERSIPTPARKASWSGEEVPELKRIN